jgi:hypothetical protein
MAVIDDNQHLRWRGRVYPENATFGRFLTAFLDLPGAPVASIAHVIPVRNLPADAPEPATRELDPRIEVIATAPFDGIAGYVRHLPVIAARNVRPLREAIRGADLVWLKVPASNAPFAALVAARKGTPLFGYFAGSVVEVVRGQRRRGLRGLIARSGATIYDALAKLASGPHLVVVGRDLMGAGVVTSLVESAEIRSPRAEWPRQQGRLSLAWAGRLANGKGLETVLEAVAVSPEVDRVSVLGHGPARDRLVANATTLGVADKVRWLGYVSDRPTYLQLLAEADVFVFPSPAEGFPKVVLDAMAVGLPVIASPAGTLAELVSEGLFEPVPAGDPAALRAALAGLLARPSRAAELSSAGAAFAAAHTRDAEASRLVRFWRAAFPTLPWDT